MTNNTYIEEDEIDLKELFLVIWSNKIKLIIFTFIITSLTILYTLSIPNSYKSSTSLISQTQAKPSLGGLSALAGMAGINLGSSGKIDAVTSFNTILKDFNFQKFVIKKYNLDSKLILNKNNLVFALGFDGIYNIFHTNSSTKINKSQDDIIYSTYKKIQNMVSIDADKKSGIINLSVESNDRFLAKELVDIYLKELTSYLRTIEMQDVNKQILYYNKELQNTDDLAMKDQLSQLASSLIQKKVLSQANEYYNVKQLTKSQIAYIKEKSKPKRGLIVIVSFITSSILGIFLIFFINFIKESK